MLHGVLDKTQVGTEATDAAGHSWVMRRNGSAILIPQVAHRKLHRPSFNAFCLAADGFGSEAAVGPQR